MATEPFTNDLVYRPKTYQSTITNKGEIKHPNQFPVVLGADRCLFVDIDKTLIKPLTEPPPDVSDYAACVYVGDILYQRLNHNIQLVRRFAASDGVDVILWSAGGARWAWQVCRALGLQDAVTACISKPSWYLDDLVDAGFAAHADKFIDATKGADAWKK